MEQAVAHLVKGEHGTRVAVGSLHPPEGRLRRHLRLEHLHAAHLVRVRARLRVRVGVGVMVRVGVGVRLRVGVGVRVRVGVGVRVRSHQLEQRLEDREALVDELVGGKGPGLGVGVRIESGAV